MPKRLIISKWEKYNRLTIIEEVEKQWQYRHFLCKCNCGSIKNIRLSSLRNWHIKSCWCYIDSIRHNTRNNTHWMSKNRIYKIFTWLKDRCNNINNKRYKDWGGRWIKCLWNSFEEFYKDMWVTYKKWLSIDRINNNWNYCKNNCRWATYTEQARNKRNNRIYKWKCITEWCEELNIWRWKIWHMIYEKWLSLELAINSLLHN